MTVKTHGNPVDVDGCKIRCPDAGSKRYQTPSGASFPSSRCAWGWAIRVLATLNSLVKRGAVVARQMFCRQWPAFTVMCPDAKPTPVKRQGGVIAPALGGFQSCGIAWRLHLYLHDGIQGARLQWRTQSQ